MNILSLAAVSFKFGSPLNGTPEDCSWYSSPPPGNVVVLIFILNILEDEYLIAQAFGCSELSVMASEPHLYNLLKVCKNIFFLSIIKERGMEGWRDMGGRSGRRKECEGKLL